MNIELRRARRGLRRSTQYYFRIVHWNGKVLCDSIWFDDRAHALQVIGDICNHPGFKLVDLTNERV